MIRRSTADTRTSRPRQRRNTRTVAYCGETRVRVTRPVIIEI